MMTERIDSLIVEKYGIDGAKAFSDLRLRSLSIDRYKKRRLIRLVRRLSSLRSKRTNF